MACNDTYLIQNSQKNHAEIFKILVKYNWKFKESQYCVSAYMEYMAAFTSTLNHLTHVDICRNWIWSAPMYAWYFYTIYRIYTLLY